MKINLEEKVFPDKRRLLFVNGIVASEFYFQSFIKEAQIALNMLEIKVQEIKITKQTPLSKPFRESLFSTGIGELNLVSISSQKAKVYYPKENSFQYEYPLYINRKLVSTDCEPSRLRKLIESFGYRTELYIEEGLIITKNSSKSLGVLKEDKYDLL